MVLRLPLPGRVVGRIFIGIALCATLALWRLLPMLKSEALRFAGQRAAAVQAPALVALFYADHHCGDGAYRLQLHRPFIQTVAGLSENFTADAACSAPPASSAACCSAATAAFSFGFFIGTITLLALSLLRCTGRRRQKPSDGAVHLLGA